MNRKRNFGILKVLNLKKKKNYSVTQKVKKVWRKRKELKNA
jgi:hypothetical protein